MREDDESFLGENFDLYILAYLPEVQDQEVGKEIQFKFSFIEVSKYAIANGNFEPPVFTASLFEQEIEADQTLYYIFPPAVDPEGE